MKIKLQSKFQVYEIKTMILIEPLPKFFRIQSVTDTSVAMIILGAFAYVPATGIIYLLNERTRKEKRLQYICGVGTFLYWLTSLLWDMVIIIIVQNSTQCKFILCLLL